jgi:hypothetical protein
MKPFAVCTLLLALNLAWARPAEAQRISVAENARQSANAAREQQKTLRKAEKRQRNAMKKSERAQRKALKKANRHLR